MRKKIVALSMAVLMLAVAVIGGTLAYFTDTDKATNTFTAGGVDIALHEANKETPAKVDKDYQKWLEDQVLMPGDNQTNTIAKRVYVENTGKSDAYVRVHIAIPSVLDNADPDFDASANLLHFNATEASYAEGKWNWGTKSVKGRTGFIGSGDTWNCYTTTIDDISYNVYVVTYESALAKTAVTDDAMHQVYLYKDVTNKDIEQANAVLGANWKVLVFAEAGQTDGFADPFTALNTQFGDPLAAGYVDPWNQVQG